MEFFMIAGLSPKKVQHDLCLVSGFPQLPPIYSLGFHYSKWENETVTGAGRILEYNARFTESEIPVDVFWMDIPATNGNRYFTFN